MIRLAVTVVALVGAIAAGGSVWWIEGASRRQARQSLAARIEAEGRMLGRSFDSSGQRMAGELARVAADPSQQPSPHAGVDWTVLLDRDARVIRCSYWPERVDLVAVELGRLPLGRPVVEWVEGPAGPLLARMVRLSTGTEGRTLVGGQDLDEGLLAPIRPGFVGALLDLTGHSPRVLAGTEPTGEPNLRLPLEGVDAQPVATLAIGADPAPRGTVTGRFTGHALPLIALGGLVGGLMGMWLGRRLVAPGRRLARALESIAGDQADYAFLDSATDELERLTGRVSGIKRSLDFERRQAAAAERVAAWSEVARHVAHEVKNPLVPIRLTVENLCRARDRHVAGFDALFDEGTTTILEEVDQLQRLVSEFTEFARLPEPRLQSVDVERLIAAVVELYRAEPGLTIETHAGVDLPPLLGDPDQLSRVLKNIVGNAVEALRELPDTTDRLIEVRAEVVDAHLRVDVSDNGPGLPDGGADRVFQYGYTTKRQGSGLGMAIVDRIVTQHGGVVTAVNRKTRGARVRLELPLRSDPGDTA